MKQIYLGLIEVPPAIAAKIAPRGITPDDILDTFQAPAIPLKAVWDYSPEHGRRVIALGRCGSRVLKVVLQPVDALQGTWRLRTAVVATRKDGA